MVEQMLGQADCHADNPHFKSGRPMRLYLTSRALAIEQLDTFRQAKAAAQARGALATANFTEKSKVLDRIASGIQITLPVWNDDQLRRKAMDDFGVQACETTQAQNELEAIMGHAKQAEWVLDSFFWHPGIRPVRQKLRRRILGAIVNQYPQLAHVALARGKLETGDSHV